MENFPRAKTAIVGAATFGIGEAPGFDAIDIAAHASLKALKAANLKLSDVDGLFICLPSDYLSGYGVPITQNPTTTNQNFSFEFTCPPGSDRDLYFIVCPSMDGFSGAAIG